MPRVERPLDPDGSALGEFAADLRRLRDRAGRPPYRELAARAHFSSTTLSDAAGGRRLPSLAVTLGFVRACGGDVERWEERWHAVRKESDGAPAAPVDGGEGSPYVGLASYEAADADRYVGRELLVEDLLARVRRHRFTAVFGPSGSGKSSALRAGLIPALSRDGDRRIVLITPGAQPADTLEGVLGSPGDGGPEDDGPGDGSTEDGSTEDGGPRRADDAPAGEQAAELVVVVDQFEEVFTLCADESERERFVAALLDAADDPAGRCRVVIGVRADFYPHCAQHRGLVAAMRDAQVTVGPMTTDELRRAIVEPAMKARCTVEGALVATLVSEASGRPGVLPLLSHALLETWRRRAGAKLTLAGYHRGGGIAHALAWTADSVFDGFTETQQKIARDLFVRLCALGEGTEDTRRRVSRAELDQGADHDTVIVRLVDARLIVADRQSVEITHEALIRSWPRLRRWLSEDREGLRTHRALTEATEAWEAMDRDPSGLYRGTRLEQARLWRETAESSLTERERRFLDTGERARDAELAVARRRTRRLRQLVVAVVVCALAAAAAAVVAAAERSTALRQRDDALFRQVIAESDRLQDRDPSLSAQLKLVAHRMRPADESVRTRLLGTRAAALPTGIPGHVGNVYLTSFSPDGATLASAGEDDTVRLWDVRDRSARAKQLAVLPGEQQGWLSAAVFSRNGRVLATTGKSGTVQLWNVVDPARPTRFAPPITAHSGSAYLLAFSADGGLLATANDDRTIGLWDVTDPARPRLRTVLTGHTGAVRSIAFSADGRMLVSGGDDTTVRLWDVRDPARPAALRGPLTGHDLLVHSVAFSPDGRFAVSGSQDSTVRIWDVATGASVGALPDAHTSGVWSVAFSHDGAMLVTGSADGTARLWNMSDPVRPTPLAQAAAGGDIYTVAFSPDGTRIVTGSSDGVVRLWSLPGGVLLGHHATVNAVAFRSDGELVATGGLDGEVLLWNTEDRARPVRVAGITPPAGGPASCSGSCTDVEISPDGRTLAVLSQARSLRLWDITSPTRPVPWGDALTLKTRFGAAFAFSPDGRTLAVPEDEHVVRLWDVTDPRKPAVVGRVTGDIGGNPIAFSDDGRLLAAVDIDHTIRLWDVTDRASPRAAGQLRGHANNVVTIAFAPDGRTLASAGADQTVRLWDVSDPARGATQGAVLEGHTRSVSSVAFSPDGRTLASGSTDKTVRLWDVADRARPTALGEPMATLTSRGAGLAHSPDGGFLAVTDDANAVRLLDLDVDHAIQRICTTTDAPTEAQWARYLPTLPYDPPCRARR